MGLLTQSQLKKLRDHKYSVESGSYLDPYLQPWWNFVVSLIPMWIAPNLITLFGLMINIITSVIYICHAPHATEEVAWWIPFNCGVGLFIYQTLDAIDGKQARRTGNCNALGELFDHGCDSMSTVVVAIAGCCMLGLGDLPYLMIYQCFAGSFLFYLAHWQTYVTGTMRFGQFDVTEAQFTMIGLMLLTSIFGSSFWKMSFLGIPLRWASIIFATSAALYGIPGTFDKILNGGAGRNGSTVANSSVIAPILPVVYIVVPGYIIVMYSDLFQNYLIEAIVLFALVGTKMTNKLIVAQMTKSEMSFTDSSIYILWMIAAYIYYEWKVVSLIFLSRVCTLVVGVDLLSYCVRICYEISLGCSWNVLTLNKKTVAKPQVNSSSVSQQNRSGYFMRHRKS